MRDYPPAPQVRIGEHARLPTITWAGPSPELIRYAQRKMIIEAVGAGVVGGIFTAWAALALFVRHEFGGPELDAYAGVTVVCGLGVATTTTGAITIHLFGRAALTSGVVDLPRLHGVLTLGRAWQQATALLAAVIAVTAIVVTLNTHSHNMMLLILIQATCIASGVLVSSTATVKTTLRLLASLAATPGTAGQQQRQRWC